MKTHIPREFIEQLLNRIDIVEIIDARVALKKRGANYLACCPFHTEKTPSFSVNPERQFYHCFGCKASGNALGFLMEHDGMEFVEAVEHLANSIGMEIPSDTKFEKRPEPIVPTVDLYELLEEAAKFYQAQLKHHAKRDDAVNYLKGRGLSGEIAKLFRLGVAVPGWEHLIHHFATTKNQYTAEDLLQAGLIIKKEDGKYYDRFRHRIMFPIRDRRGRVIAFGGRVLDDSTPKYLNSPETPIFHKGQELYGLHEARKMNGKLSRVIIVEGYMDVIALFQHGITYAVATLGTATSSNHLQKLFRLTSEVIFCFDGDSAGKEAAKRAFELTLPMIADNKVAKFLFLPEKEDPDSLIRKEGSTAFHKRLEKAVPLTEFFFSLLQEQVPNFNSLESRAAMAKAASEYFAKMPETYLKNLLQNELTERFKILTPEINKPKPRSKPANKATDPQKVSPVRLAITLLLQNPQLIQLIDDYDWLRTVDQRGIPLLCELIQVLKHTPNLNTGALLEHWRESSHQQTLAKLAVMEFIIPEAAMSAEFTGVIKQLQNIALDQQIQQLLEKGQVAELSTAEKQLLQQLLKLKNS